LSLVLAKRRLSNARSNRRIPPPEGSKSLELESRIGRLESLVKGLREDIAMRQRREAMLRAEFDHLVERIKGVRADVASDAE
jgi:uncharacterized coiled-coil protein SlyX